MTDTSVEDEVRELRQSVRRLEDSFARHLAATGQSPDRIYIATVGDGVGAGAAPAPTPLKSNIADRRSGNRRTSQALSSFTAGGLVFAVTVDEFEDGNSTLTVENLWAGISMSTELPARRSAGN